MDVGFVHTTRVHESGGGCETKIDKGGKGFTICKISLATGSLASSGIWIGSRVEVILEPGVGGTLRLKDGEAIYAIGSKFELVDEILGDLWVRWRYSRRIC